MKDRVISARIASSKKSVLLLGARQVGKSTLCASIGPALSINLSDEALFLSYSKDPARLKREILALRKPSLVLIDEIQRVPSLLNMVQSLMDEAQHPRAATPAHRYLLTGSSARKLRDGGVNLLPGRVIVEHLDPLMVREVGDGFDLKRALRLGMLPGVYLGDEESSEVLASYADTYLREEVRAESLTRDIGGYARFLDVAAVVSGQWLNYSKLSSETEIPKETIRRYVSILEDTLLMFRLPPFQPRAGVKRRVLQQDKLLLFDVGVRNALLGSHRREIPQDQIGAVFEQWLVLQLIYLNRAGRHGWKLSSYRSDGGAEVDLVIDRGDDVMGIEIKASRNVGKTDLRGLQSLGEIVGPKKPYLKRIAYLGETEQVFEDGSRAVPYLQLLKELG